MAVEGKSRRNKSKKNRKLGRNRFGDPKCGPAAARYVQGNHRFYNKLRRVAKYNGNEASLIYSANYKAHETKSLAKVKGKK